MKAILRSINNFSCKLKESNNQKYNISPKTSNNKLKNISGNGNIVIEDAIVKSVKDYKIHGNTKQSILPDGYTQVDYIESSGTQYIDTGVNADSNLQTILDMAYMNSSLFNQNVGTIHTTNTTVDGRYHLLCQSYCFRFYANDKSVDIGQKDNNRHIFNFDIPNRKLYNDGNEYSIDIEDFDTELNFWLFGRNSNLSSLIYYSRIKQWACKMYYNNVLVRDFIPCYRNSDNEVGLYDLVNNVFYTNQGTGVFTYGSVAPTPDIPIDMVSCGDKTGNLFDKDSTDIITGKYLTQTGTMATDLSWLITPYIKVEAGESYTYQGLTIAGNAPYSCYYDSSKTFISSFKQATGTNTITIPSGVSYVRFSINNNNTYLDAQTFMIEEGSTATSYEPYGYKIPVNVRSDNLFDKDSTTKNEFLDSNGDIVERTDNVWYLSDYIPVKPNKNYTYQGLTFVGTAPYSAYYDINKNFISTFKQAIGQNTILIPNNACYVRFSIINRSQNQDLPSFMIEEGSTAPSKYIPYYNETTNIYLDEPLRKIDEYSDYIDFVNSKVVRNIKEHVFTSNDDVRNGTASQDGYARVGWGARSEIAVSDFDKSLVICNKFLGVPQNNNTPSITGKKWQCSLSNTDNFKIMFRSGDLNLNSTEFISLIKNNNIKVCYLLLTPTEEDIELPELNLIEGKNIITIGTEVQGAIETEYYSQEIMDISNYKYNLRKVED